MERTKTPDKAPPRLGRGLAALIPPQGGHIPHAAPPDAPATAATAPGGVLEIALADIRANAWQPRTAFDDDALNELAASIKAHGVLQPVMVRPRGGGRYELVAGERRFRASERAGLTHIPAVVRALTDEESLTVALIENIQREDLNPMEAAHGYKQLTEQFGLTQAQLGEQIGKKQSTISNVMRLLNLPSEMQESIASGSLSLEHGKILLSVEDATTQKTLWRDFIDLKLSRNSARDHAEAAKVLVSPTRRAAPKNPDWQALEERLKRAFGMKVSLTIDDKGGGTLSMKFSGSDALVSILEKLQT